jgi:hypothetical protein
MVYSCFALKASEMLAVMLHHAVRMIADRNPSGTGTADRLRFFCQELNAPPQNTT